MNKIHHVFNFMKYNVLSILVVCETWLSVNTPSSYVDLPGFKFFRSDSGDNIKKHGVGVNISYHLTPFEVLNSMKNTLVIYLKEWDVFLVAIYRPPSYLESDNESLINVIRQNCFGKNAILLGDLNLPSLKWAEDYTLDGYVTPLDLKFSEVFVECGLTQWIREGTFVPSGNILDLVFTSESDSVGQYKVYPPFPNCHHSPVVIDYLPAMYSQKEIQSQIHLCWRKGNYDSVNRELMCIDWSTIALDSMDDSYDSFLNILQICIADNIPKFNKKMHIPSWLKRPPRSLYDDRSRLWLNYKGLRAQFGRRDIRTSSALEDFQGANRVLKNYSIRRKLEYERGIISSINTAPKLFHSYIRHKKRVGQLLDH